MSVMMTDDQFKRMMDKYQQILDKADITLRWDVTTKYGEVEDIGANTSSVIEGSLLFYDKEGNLAVAYAPGTWLNAMLTGPE
jgi:hypothetical protein